MIENIDCLDGLKNIRSESVDLIITSPPYKIEDGYDVTFLSKVYDELFRVLKKNSLFFLNFGHLAENKFRPFETCLNAMIAGFRLNDTITWVKNHYKPIQGSKRLNNLTEFIFLLYKGDMPNIDRLKIGVPYKDISNAKRFANGNNLKCRGNVWYINYPTIRKKEERLHPDGFPVELPELCIKVSGVADGATVLDCFSGAGTTALAAKKLNKNFIGFEKNKDYFEISQKRLNDYA